MPAIGIFSISGRMSFCAQRNEALRELDSQVTEAAVRLCLFDHRVDCKLSELIEALQSGRATPESLFEWAVSQRSKDLNYPGLSLWHAYEKRGKGFC